MDQAVTTLRYVNRGVGAPLLYLGEERAADDEPDEGIDDFL